MFGSPEFQNTDSAGGLHGAGAPLLHVRQELGAGQPRGAQAGRSSGAETQILSGLREGDEVILYPSDRLKDGQKVQPTVISPAP